MNFLEQLEDDSNIAMTAHINEHGQLVNDEGQIINEHGQILTEDGQPLVVDETVCFSFFFAAKQNPCDACC